MNERDPNNSLKTVRIERCIELSNQATYGGSALVEFDKDDWMDSVVNKKVRCLRDRNEFNHLDIKVFEDEYTWKDVNTYQQSDWYRFQEAVKKHQEIGIAVLQENVFSKMELEAF